MASAPTETDPAPKAKRRKRNAEATKAEILAAAMEEFADKGLSGARVEEIAARTETSKHMIYYHFGSKDGLYSAVLELAYAEFRLAEGAADYDLLQPTEALAQLVGATFDIHARHPQIVRIIMGENINFGQQIRTIDVSGQGSIALDTLRAILDRGTSEGTFASGLDALQIHLTISALAFHYIANAHTFGHVFGIEANQQSNLEVRRAEVVRTVLDRCIRDQR